MEQIKKINLKKGLNIPIAGIPKEDTLETCHTETVALLGDDYVGMKPSMRVHLGDNVALGQILFVDKKNEGVCFTSPASGEVIAINRGAKRKFESLVIKRKGNETVTFLDNILEQKHSAKTIRETLIESGLWPALRTRPFGKVPAIHTNPHSLFITAIDTRPLAAHPHSIIKRYQKEYQKGLAILRSFLDCPIHYCCGDAPLLECEMYNDIDYTSFTGPHPAGLASTHIHFIDPVYEEKMVWHIDYHDVVAIGFLFINGHLNDSRVIAIGGPDCNAPQLVETNIGANLSELCKNRIINKTNKDNEKTRYISGSVLCGRPAKETTLYLGRYANQVSLLPDNDGRDFFNWAILGKNRFSAMPIFLSTFLKPRIFSMNTALWGGKRAIYPIASYDQVMPLDIIPIQLLKSIETGQTDKSKDLGCLELIEEDLALCSFVCPGKNDFGVSLRKLLTAIELGD